MSALMGEKREVERRSFPRIRAICPVHYLTHKSGDWCVAELNDYSANGVCFLTDETILSDTEITLRIMRNPKVRVPPMSAIAVVVRCEVNEDHRYKVACKLTRVRHENYPRRNESTPLPV
jgi:hypothetical protein